jgi:hypothetical protein
MLWLIALAAVVISIGAGLLGMLSHNTPLFIGGWIASFVSILAMMGAVWAMLMGARRDRIRREGEDAADPWDGD